MSKRSASSSAATDRAKRGSGVLYLARALNRLQLEREFVVDADEDDYTRWSVAIPAETLHDDTLRRELRTFASNTRQPAVVALRVVFPPDYPDAVPYVRVVRPRFVYQTGHVTIGGSFCSEVLTAQGWRPMTVDALLRSLVLTLHEGRARIQLRPDAHCGKPLVDYDEREASAAYQRALMTHGWA